MPQQWQLNAKLGGRPATVNQSNFYMEDRAESSCFFKWILMTLTGMTATSNDPYIIPRRSAACISIQTFIQEHI